MISTKRTQEEKNISRVILLGSTFVILVLSLVVAYLFISVEIEESKRHLKTFEHTLVQHERHAIKTITDNLVNDMLEEQRGTQEEIRRRVKGQTMIVYDLIQSILAQNTLKNKAEIMDIVIQTMRAITIGNDLDFYIFDIGGTLVFNSSQGIGEGENFMDFRDINEETFVRDIIEKNAFVEYIWFVPNKSMVSRKITYSKKVEALGMIIGSGEFLDARSGITENLNAKMNREQLNENEFVFVYEIMSLDQILKDSKLVVQKNIATDVKTLKAVKEILIDSDYTGERYLTYDQKILYATFMPTERLLIASGFDLKAISHVFDEERQKSRDNLEKKIWSLGVNILIVALIFFMLSYLISKRIEKMFKSYRIRVARSQQLLIQKSKMAAMGEMIANITHQWRQPLSQLSGLFHDIESAYDYKELDKTYLSTRVDEANDVIEYMSETMEEFKSFFSPDTDMEIFTVYEGIEKALKMIDSSLQAHHVEIEVKVDKTVQVKGVLNAFSQVILNILSNAKEVALLREIMSPKIVVESRSDDRYVYIVIADNAGGIDEEIIEKIFEPYVTTKYAYGTGIGLYMSKLIIENKMHGSIHVENDTKGALFVLKLHSFYINIL